MKIIRTNLIPHGYAAMSIWPVILVSKDSAITDRLIRHEQIHHAQQKEMLLVFFYLWYGIEYLIRLCQHRNHDEAYSHISFEAEAYGYERWPEYLEKRKIRLPPE